MIGPEICAVLLEPIQGEGGVVLPPEGHLAGERALCDARDVLFLADTVHQVLTT